MLEELKGRFKKQKSIEVTEEQGKYHIKIDKKSRFIMKDSEKLVEKLEGIDLGRVKVEVVNGICSKSIRYLSEKGISIVKNK